MALVVALPEAAALVVVVVVVDGSGMSSSIRGGALEAAQLRIGGRASP